MHTSQGVCPPVSIRPHAYTKKEWYEGPHAMFYYNVEEDKRVLYESN